jgi:hypothetical protein
MDSARVMITTLMLWIDCFKDLRNSVALEGLFHWHLMREKTKHKKKNKGIEKKKKKRGM